MGVAISVNTIETGNQISECLLPTFVNCDRDSPSLSKNLIDKILTIKLLLYSKGTPEAVSENDEALPNCRIVVTSMYQRRYCILETLINVTLIGRSRNQTFQCSWKIRK